MKWRHPTDILIGCAAAVFRTSRKAVTSHTDRHSSSVRNAVCFLSVRQFMVSASRCGELLGMSQPAVVQAVRAAENNGEPDYQRKVARVGRIAIENGAMPVRANRQQKLERKR